MPQCIHAKKGKSDKLSFRIWSSVTDSYVTVPFSSDELRRWLVFYDGIQLYKNWTSEFDALIKRAEENGTSSLLEGKRSTNQWDKNREKNSNCSLPVSSDVEADFPELSPDHRAALAILPPEVSYVAAAMLKALA